MLNSIDSIIQVGQNYYNEIPSDIMPKMARSAVYSFAITYTLHSGTPSTPINLAKPLLASATAALASLIYGLTTPLFNQAFEDDRILVHREVFKHCINISLVSAIIDYAMFGKVNLLAVNLFKCLPINLFKGISESTIAFSEWIDQSFANELRSVSRFWGIDALPGSNSTFVNFGDFPVTLV